MALLDILEKSVRELACVRHAASSGVSIQTNDRVSQSEETSYSIPKAFLGKMLTHQFEPGISKRDRKGLELRKSMRSNTLRLPGKESIVTKRVSLGELSSELELWRPKDLTPGVERSTAGRFSFLGRKSQRFVGFLGSGRPTRCALCF